MSHEPNTPPHDAVPAATPSGGAVFARVMVLAVVGALAAALAQFAVSRMTDVFHLPPELAALGGGNIPGAEDQARIVAGRRVLFYKHTALWLGSAGAILGGLFGLALGAFRRSAGAVWRGTIGGLLLGALCGCAAGPMAVTIERRLDARLAPHESHVADHQLILLHAATWLVIGAGIGLGVGLGAPTRRLREAARSMLLAAIAAAMGGSLYQPLAGVLLPLADTTLPLPAGHSEWMLWLALPSAFIGLALGRKG